MAEPWNSWDSCVNDSTESGWNADVVLTTGNLDGDQGSSSASYERNKNSKTDFKRNDYTNNNWKERNADGSRNNSNNFNNRTKNEWNTKKETKDYRNDRNDVRRDDRYNNRNETVDDGRRDKLDDRNKNMGPNSWQDKKNCVSRSDVSRNNTGNYQSKGNSKYNKPFEKNVSRGRPHEVQNRNENTSPYGESRGKSQNRYRNRSTNRGPRYEKKIASRNTSPESNSTSLNKSFKKSNEYDVYKTKGFYNSTKDNIDFRPNQRKNSNTNNSVNKQDNEKRTHKKEDYRSLQQFQEPPQLFAGEGKVAVDNDFEDSASNKFSSKSESITSSDQHEVEMKILNMIHEFKTTLHLVEIKPSLHVQTEIKGLQKYIGLIFEKWNPKLKGNISSSDSESSDSSDEKQKKRKSENKKKKKGKKSSQKEDEKSVNNEYRNNEIINTDNQNPARDMHGNVTQFQENTLSFLNNQPMPRSVNYAPPHLAMPPLPPMYQHNINPTFPLYPGIVQMQPNFPPSHMVPTVNQETPTKTFVTSQTSHGSNLKGGQSIPNKSASTSKKSHLSSGVLSIVNDIRVSSVVMSKAHIKEMKAALDKLSLVDKSNLNITDLSKDFKNINICMLKVVENETLSHNIKYAILDLLEELFKHTCDEKAHGEVQKLICIYQKALDESKNNTHFDYDYENDQAFEQFKNLSNDKSSVNEILAFKDKAKEAMVSHTQNNTLVTSDTSSASENETEDDTSEDENVNSDEEKDERQDKNIDQRRGKRNITFSGELGLHCKSFLKNGQSIQEQVNYALEMYSQLQSSENKSAQQKLMYTIKDMVKKMYPNCILHLFGSRVSNMALPDSDMDIYIDVTGQGYFNGASYEDQQLFVKKIRKLFYQKNDIFSNILGLMKTKVPIIKIHHKVSAINCDISFKNGISVENSNLLCYYLSLDPRVKWLVTAVKLWAHYNHIYASDFFTSHALSWLVLFYLMEMKIVPPVLLLKANVKPRIIDDWDIAYKKLTGWTPAAEPSSGLVLFKDFFRFLIHANLKNSVLCTHTGEFISKESISDLGVLEVYKNGIFKEYVERIRKSEYTDFSAKENPSSMPMQMTSDQLCIQDPFEFSKNISNPVKQKKFEHFNTLCCLTLKQLVA